MGRKSKMDFDQWLAYGVDRKWCLYPVCEIHDGIPMTLDEELQFEQGLDPCVHILRLTEDEASWDEAYGHMKSTLRHRIPYPLESQEESEEIE
jgi:hypothetical protein